MTHEQVLSMQPAALAEWLAAEFLETLPEEITSVEDMEDAAKLLLKLSSSYSYLCALSSKAKIVSRDMKRSGDKEAYEDMVDRREAIGAITDAVKQQYSAVSRSVTIKIENDRELQMNSNGYIAGPR